MSRTSDWVLSNIDRAIKREGARMKPLPPIGQGNGIPEPEQIRRFLAGDERWRVDVGLVSPRQFAEYEAAMLKRVGHGGK